MKWLKFLFNKQEEKPLEIDTDRLESWFNEQTQIKLNILKRNIRTLFSDIETKIIYIYQLYFRKEFNNELNE